MLNLSLAAGVRQTETSERAPVASKTILICDVCGADAATSATLSVADSVYTVDLCARHMKELDAATKVFTSTARSASRTRRVTRPSGKTSGKATGKKVPATASARKATSRATAKKAGPSPRRARRAGANTAEIRAWGQANGYRVGAKGRLRPDVVEAYTAAHSSKRTKS